VQPDAGGNAHAGGPVPPHRANTLTVIAAIAGIALFVYAVAAAGVGPIVDGVVRVGWGLLPILALAGLRFVVRAEAWRLCTPVGSRLTLRQAFMAFLAGDALGNITPLGLIASEPTKVLLTRHQLATRESVSSLAIDNLVYALSVTVMIAAGLVVMLATVPLSFEMREWSVMGLAALAAVCAAGVRVLRQRHGPVRSDGSRWSERMAKLRQSLSDAAAHPGRLWRAFVFDVFFHALAVFEAFLTLRWLLGDRSPTLAEAIMFESLNRVITAAFKFVPLRVGVDEAATGAFAPLIGLQPVAGVSLAIVRKVRGLFWMGVGLAFIAVYHSREAPAAGRHGSVPAPRT
jgi:hypothetical protein